MSLIAFIPIIGDLIDRLLPDKAASEAAKLRVMELAQAGQLAELEAQIRLMAGQQDINKTEAAHASVFVSGWRPFIGWVGGMALVYQFIARPLLAWASVMKGFPVPPELDMGDLITIVGGMLGLAGARTIEKINGVARN